jgi:hypothetical protein
MQPLQEKLVVAISSRALFNLDERHAVFEDEGTSLAIGAFDSSLNSFGDSSLAAKLESGQWVPEDTDGTTNGCIAYTASWN